MGGQIVLHSNERGKRGSVPQFPEVRDGQWEEIWFLWHGGAYVRGKYGDDGQHRREVLFRLVQGLSDMGDVFARNLLGVLHELGLGTPKDDIVAADLYRNVALRQELPVAWYNLGMNYQRRNLHYQAVETFLTGKRLGCTWCTMRLA